MDKELFRFVVYISILICIDTCILALTYIMCTEMHFIVRLIELIISEIQSG